MNNKKTALITGATSGIGTVIAKHLVQKGYSLIILGRSAEKLDSLIDGLKSSNSSVEISGVLCDLSSLDAMNTACDQIKESRELIDVMILNAGLWNSEFVETGDGIEETLQVNLIAPILLLDQLKALIPKNGESKVIFTSSGLHQGTIHFSDIEFRNKYSGFKAYRQSKLCLLMLTRLLASQPENLGISFYSVHPGVINTQIGRNFGWFYKMIFKLIGKSKEKGVLTHLHLIDRDNTELKSGEYYANRKVTQTTSYSYDMNEAKKLWEVLKNYFDKHAESV